MKTASIKNGKFKGYIAKAAERVGLTFDDLMCVDEMGNLIGAEPTGVNSVVDRYKKRGWPVPTELERECSAVPILYVKDDATKAFIAARREELARRSGVAEPQVVEPVAPKHPTVAVPEAELEVLKQISMARLGILERIAVALERLAGAWEQR